MSDVSQSDCSVEFIANWVDVWTCNPSRTLWVRSEVTISFMLLPGEGLSEERHAWNIYLDESFGCLLIHKNSSKNALMASLRKLLSLLFVNQCHTECPFYWKGLQKAADCGGAWPLSLSPREVEEERWLGTWGKPVASPHLPPLHTCCTAGFVFLWFV